jgi:hypothetical protein
LDANDDSSTALVNLPFTANFFGATFPGLYVNNNGNVTFDGPLSNYTPFTINADTPRIIAPFLADVDTRGAGSSLVTYGQVEFGSRQAFCVNWNRVGYYSHQTDKLNSFQLLLVDRSDVGQGDFDIVMNYDAITWETGSASGGSGGFGGTSAGAGFSAGDGNTDHFFQFPGSMVHGGLLDTHATTGLVNGSRGTLQTGRYLFPIRNGAAPGSASIVGTVTDNNGNPQVSAPVQACPENGGSCVVGFTGSTGHYAIVGMAAGSWNLIASPPAGSTLLQATAGPLTLAEGQQLEQNLVLTGPQGIPDDATITNNGETGDGVPIVYWGEPLTVTADGCVGGSAQYTLAQDGNVLRSGPMAETPVGSGHYQGTMQPLYPDHGDARMTIAFTCPTPGSDPGDIVFDIYIDPSGTVVDTRGRPVSGATVELRRSDTQGGPFAAVPDGSAIMSPSNRVNPVTTGADGIFHWDVLAGFYQVRASKAGCHVPNSEETVATSAVYEVPPPALDIELTLDCGEGGGGGGGGGGQAAVTLTWETPAPIAYPTPLGATQLSATAPVPGTLTYTKNGQPVTVGTVLPVGEHQVRAEFMPENLNAYLSANLTRTITVTRGQQAITVDPVATVPAGTATTTVTARGGDSGQPVTFTSNTPEVCTVAGTDGTSPVTATIAIASAGTCTLVAAQAGNENWDAAADVPVTFQIRSAPRAPLLDRRVSANRVKAGGSLTAPALSTRQDEELLVALVSAAGPARKAQSVTAVTGGGLTWTRAARSNAAEGTTEVWQATTTARLTDVRVTAKLKVAGVRGSITVAAFSGAGDQVTATAVGGARTGAPRAVLTPGASNSVVWAVGHNAAVAASVRVPSGQSVVHQYAEKRAKDSYWVQTVSAVTLAGTPIGVRATTPATGRWQLTAVEIPAAETVPTAVLDRRVSADRYKVGKNLVAPALTTRRENELLVAFLSADGPKAKRQQFTAVTGGGLTWTLAARSNDAGGTTEVWQAFSTAKLSKVRVNATLKVAGYRGSITVAGFSGAGSELAATAAGGAATGAPTVSLTPEAANSVVWAVGHNAAKAATVRVPAGQSVVHQYAEKKAKDSYWVQTVNGLTRTGTSVTVTASSPNTGRWQLVAVEIPVAGSLAGGAARS